VHGEAEDGYPVIVDALVNICATLATAGRAGLRQIPDETAGSGLLGCRRPASALPPSTAEFLTAHFAQL
jgi:hypothetical protein